MTRVPLLVLLLAAGVAPLLAACGAVQPGAAPVTIVAAVPDAALPGATVTLTGSGFRAGMTLVLDGIPVAASVASDDRLTFTVPDTPGYPRIELGAASAERLLFVGADYTGPRTTAALQEALDELPPGIALRLPSGTFTGDYLVLDARWLFGRGADEDGTRFEIAGTAWYLRGSGLAELAFEAGQHVAQLEAPLDPSTPFQTQGVAHASNGTAAADAHDADAGAATWARDVRFEFSDPMMPWFFAAPQGPYRLERAVVSGPVVQLQIATADVRMHDVEIDVMQAYVFARHALELRDVELRTFANHAVSVPDVEHLHLERVRLAAGTRVSIEVGHGVPGDADVRMSALDVTAHDLYVRSLPRLHIEDLTVAAARDVLIETIFDDLTIVTGRIAAAGVALTSDDGSLRLSGVDLDLADAGHVDALVDPGAAFMYAFRAVDIEGGVWSATSVEIEVGAATGAGPIQLQDTVATAASSVWLNVAARGDVLLDGVTLSADALRVEGADVAITDSQLTGTGSLDVDAHGELSVRDTGLASGLVAMDGKAGFRMLRSTLSSTVGGTLASSEGAGLIEDAVLSIRSTNGITIGGSTGLTMRRVHFVFGIGLVFVAPPGELVLEDVTGADGAETPGQP